MFSKTKFIKNMYCEYFYQLKLYSITKKFDIRCSEYITIHGQNCLVTYIFMLFYSRKVYACIGVNLSLNIFAYCEYEFVYVLLTSEIFYKVHDYIF